MANCLGIYLSNDVVRYAKLSNDSKEIDLLHYGTRFVKFDREKLIQEIIEETNSQEALIAINPENSTSVNIQMYDQDQTKSYLSDIAKMEFEAWCENNAKIPNNYSYIYKVTDNKTTDGKKNAVINISEKSTIDKFITNFSSKVASIYPSEWLTDRLVSPDERNYIVVNFDNELTVTTYLDGKSHDIKQYDNGMDKILKDFTLKLGSYQKSYDSCKQMNVYSGGNDNNDKELEVILEPHLQNVLRNVQESVNRYRKNISRVFITGSGIVFTNIDILFTEFLELKADILKPYFIEDTSNVRNMAEILETTEAIALAYDVLEPKPKTSEYVVNSKKNLNIKGLLKGNRQTRERREKVPKSQKDNTNNSSFDFSDEKIHVALICAGIVVSIIFFAYIIFSNIYVNKVNEMKKNIIASTESLKAKTGEVQSDSSYITNNQKKYKDINDNVQSIVQQIESNQIGKFTTYNVATFLQNIIKIIPKNVQLVNISSDDNKNVKIKAQSNSYADLGYFVSELKLNNTLNSIKINNIQNGEVAVIEIGGELP